MSVAIPPMDHPIFLRSGHQIEGAANAYIAGVPGSDQVYWFNTTFVDNYYTIAPPIIKFIFIGYHYVKRLNK